MDSFTGWTRNVMDHYKDKSVEEIREELKSTAHPFAVLMENWKGDFNLSTMIRNANGFNAKEVFYFGKKKFDRRGAVGSYHYVNLQHLSNFDKVLQLKKEYWFIGIDNNVGKRKSRSLEEPNLWENILAKIGNNMNPLFIFGEEGEGITGPLLDLCDVLVDIPMFGSVRSFNEQNNLMQISLIII